jgi:hypothetical protein
VVALITTLALLPVILIKGVVPSRFDVIFLARRRPMRTLVPPEWLPKYGWPNYSNRHRKRLEGTGVLPPRVQLTYHKHAYVEEELIEKTNAAIAKRDAMKVAT